MKLTSEVLQQLDLSERTLGKDLLGEDIGNLLDRDAFAGLVVLGSAGRREEGSSVQLVQRTPNEAFFWARALLGREAYQTMPYAPCPSSFVTL